MKLDMRALLITFGGQIARPFFDGGEMDLSVVSSSANTEYRQ